MSQPSTHELKRTLTPAMVWGLGVGYVISGMYFGWNLGLEKGGTLGLAIATVAVIIMCVTFTFSYAELACAIPKAGGAFDYARRALGNNWGFIACIAQSIEFIFAPPAIAFAIGSYFNLFFPGMPVVAFALIAYGIFTALNIYGVKTAAIVELLITILAVAELLLFSGIVLPHLEWSHLTAKSFPHGWPGVFAALPFAFWFFLGIEGIANVAEEAINPNRTILVGFTSAIITLVILSQVTLISSVGVSGWEAVVYNPDGSPSDSPLPLAMAQVTGGHTIMFHLLITVGLFGLIASFHGLMLAGGRSTFEFGRMKFAPGFLGRINPRFQTPANALIANMLIGILALLTGKTGAIITLSVFGALTLYVISMISLLRLRTTEPNLTRPFVVPLYPIPPIAALIIATLSLIAVTVYNVQLAGLYLLLMGLSFGIFKLWNRRVARNNE
jgi:ethanolamine permease